MRGNLVRWRPYSGASTPAEQQVNTRCSGAPRFDRGRYDKHASHSGCGPHCGAEMFLVIGSGPAGAACASALVASGAQVLMVDGGLDLDAGRRGALSALAADPHSEWTASSTEFLRAGTAATTAGIPLKLAYGSTYPYDDPVGQPIVLDGADSRASWGRGGLSAVWGASILPYR